MESNRTRLYLITLSACFVCAAPPLVAEEVEATLHWARRVELSVPVSGVVQEVSATIGQRVEQGAILLSLDARGFRARLREAQAQVDRIGPELEEASRELERAEDLYERTVLSDHELEVAKINFAKLDAQHRIERAALVQAKLDFENSTLRAPFDGIIVSRQVEVGQTVVTHCQSVPLVTLAEADRLIARAHLPADKLAGLKPGQEISVSMNGRRVLGAIHALSVEPVTQDPSNPRYALDAIVTRPTDMPVRVGQRVTLDFP